MSWLDRSGESGFPMSHFCRAPGALLIVSLVLGGWVSPCASAPSRPPAASTAAGPFQLPGEFESQEGLLLAWHPDLEAPLLSIIRHTWRKLKLSMLVMDPVDQQMVENRLKEGGVPRAGVHFLKIPYETVWTRDYGPVTVYSPDGTRCIVDGHYEDGVGDSRRQDDAVPRAFGRRFHVPCVESSITVEGGNLLSNGDGLMLTTTGLLGKNAHLDEKGLTRSLERYYGARYVVYLTPLSGEATGHVDMFAAFTDRRTVVVGQYPPSVDAVNAHVLDENAKRLEAVVTPWGSLRVVRIPMPPPGKQFWRTYTNILFANGTLLVPTYPDVQDPGQAAAFQLYRRLLPGWDIVGIDCNHLIRLEGALRCLTMNLPPSRAPRLPVAAKRRKETAWAAR